MDARQTLYDFTKGTSNDYGSSLSFGGAGLLGLSTNFGLQDISRSVSLTRFSKSDMWQVIKLPAEMTDACFNKPIITSFSYWSAQSIILSLKRRPQQQRHFDLKVCYSPLIIITIISISRCNPEPVPVSQQLTLSPSQDEPHCILDLPATLNTKRITENSSQSLFHQPFLLWLPPANYKHQKRADHWSRTRRKTIPRVLVRDLMNARNGSTGQPLLPEQPCCNISLPS